MRRVTRIEQKKKKKWNRLLLCHKRERERKKQLQTRRIRNRKFKCAKLWLSFSLGWQKKTRADQYAFTVE